jgi:hypothetical protein
MPTSSGIARSDAVFDLPRNTSTPRIPALSVNRASAGDSRLFRDDKELAILLYASRMPAAADAHSFDTDLPEGCVDWDRLLRLARSHAVTPLLLPYLIAQPAGTVPGNVLSTVREDVTTGAARNLLLASELLTISRAFRTCKIEHLSFKGPAMAGSLFGRLDRRLSNDIDVVVPRHQLKQACSVLGELGFFDKSHLSSRQLDAAFHFSREHSFSRGGVDLDLHWRLVETFASPSLDETGIWERAVETPLFGQTVPAMSPEDLLIALCLHAGGHDWLHLSLFCDIAMLLLKNPQLNWETAFRHVQDSNTRRIVCVSLYLTSLYWKAALPAEIQAQIAADPEVFAIAHYVVTQLWPQPDSGFAKHAPFHWLLRRTRGERLRDRMRYVGGITLVPTLIDFETFSLPRALIPLYPFLRAARLALKYGKHMGSRTLLQLFGKFGL